jgi:hypothetical protein
MRMLALFVTVVSCTTSMAADSELATQLEAAGDNREEIEKTLANSENEHSTAIRFLVRHMPERDLQNLSANFLLTNTRHAYEAWRNAPWADSVPEDVFLNDVLPYASINERRDDWRADFRNRFTPLVAKANSTSEAVT